MRLPLKIAEKYLVKKGSHKHRNKTYKAGDILPSAGIPERNIVAMLHLDQIEPIISEAEQQDEPERKQRGRPPKR